MHANPGSAFYSLDLSFLICEVGAWSKRLSQVCPPPHSMSLLQSQALGTSGTHLPGPFHLFF